MGWFNRVWRTATKDLKNANAQWRDVVKIQKIEDGEKVLPPKHPREVEAFKKAANDPKLKEIIDKKDEELIQNVNKIKIESTDPPERWTASKKLPSRESEYEHRNDPTWLYGFFEPPLEKMERNRIMFREALEVLRNRMEFDSPGPDGKKRLLADEAAQRYQSQPAVQRIDSEKLNRMWQYFRPFERNDIQRVVNKRDLEALADAVEARGELASPEYEPLIEALRRKKDPDQKRFAFAQRLLAMPLQERQEYLKAMDEKQKAEKKRLDARLEEMKLLDDEFTKQAEEAAAAQENNDSEKIKK